MVAVRQFVLNDVLKMVIPVVEADTMPIYTIILPAKHVQAETFYFGLRTAAHI